MKTFWEKLKTALEKKQFWALVVGAGFILIKAFWPEFPVTEDTLNKLTLAVVGSILGISFADAAVQFARARALLEKTESALTVARQAAEELKAARKSKL